MTFRKPDQEEINTYKQYADHAGLVMQTFIAVLLIILLAVIWCASNDLGGQLIATFLCLVYGQRFLRYAAEMFVINNSYKKGLYEVCDIEVNAANIGHRTIGGKTRCEITTYKVPEINEVVDIASESQKEIIKEKRAVLIKMKVGKKHSYYLTHHVEQK